MVNIDVDANSANDDETTSLLQVLPSEVDFAIAKQDTRETFFVVAWRELKWLATSSSLTAVTEMLESIFVFINVSSVSHLGAIELSAMSLSVAVFMSFFMAPIVGLASAMETFCSTAYTASRDKTAVGFHFQRGLFAMYGYSLMILPIFWNAEKIMLAIGQDSYVAYLCGTYLRITILALIPWSTYLAYERYLHAQGIMRVGTFILIIVIPFHAVNNYVLVRAQTFGLGFVGSPVANVISDWVLLLIVAIYIYASNSTGTWGGLDLTALNNMWEYLKLAIPSVVAVCAEWIGFELLSIGTSYFGTNQLAGQAILMNTIMLITRINNGLGFGTSVRIGNLIGATKPRQARMAGNVAVAVSLLIGISGMAFICFCGKWWISIYTTDPFVIREIEKLIPTACVYLIFTNFNSVLSSILRGLGRQSMSASTYLITIYLCAIPIALYLGFYCKMEAVGLWIGLCTSALLSSIVQVVYIYVWLDWKNEVRLCMSRLRNSRGVNGQVETAVST